MFKGLPSLSVAVLGSGPRALASAICLSRHHTVTLGEATDFRRKCRLTRQSMYPDESGLEELLSRTPTRIEFTNSFADALVTADLVVVAEQPLFRKLERNFDMAMIENCLKVVARRRPRATVILEAPAPVGYSIKASLQHRLEVIPAPLLLRRGNVARDRVQPPRIVVGSNSEQGLSYAFVAVRSCGDSNTPYLLTNSSEAEAIHAFERQRALRGRSESQEEVVAYCRHRRLNEVQVLRGLQPVDYIYESQLCALAG